MEGVLYTVFLEEEQVNQDLQKEIAFYEQK
jgi:hypothetical protein